MLLLGAITIGAAGCKPHAGADPCAAQPAGTPARAATAANKPQPDLSGCARFGKASFYAREFVNRKMADGVRMNPHSDNAASKTLPLGTTALVTNLQTGQSAVVSIQDRGPYVTGRIVDLSPATARKIGITRDEGIAGVKVAPISVPLPDGDTMHVRRPAPRAAADGAVPHVRSR